MDNKNKTFGQREEQYRRIIEHVEDTLWACDLDVKLTYVSPAGKKTSGYSPEERIALSLDKVLKPASLEILKRIINEQRIKDKNSSPSPERPIRCNLENYHKDGSTYTTESSISFSRNAKGELIGLIGSSRDITERTRATAIIKAIHNSTFLVTGEQYFSDLVYQLSSTLNMRYAFIAKVENGISQTLAFCKDGQITDNFAYSLIGSPCENVVAGSLCYYPENASALFPREEAIQKMAVESYIGAPIPDTAGNVQGLLVLMDDQPIDDAPLLTSILEVCADRTGAEMNRLKTELKLQESEEQFRALFEQSLDSCFNYDQGGKIISANESMLKTFGYSREELTVTNVLALIPQTADAREAYKTALAQIFATGQTRHEGQLVKKSGETFPCEFTGKLININGKQVIQSVVRDLSVEHQIRARDKAAQLELQSLFNGLHTLIAIIKTDGTVTFTNTTSLTKSQNSQGTTLGQKLWDYPVFHYDPALQARVKSDIAAATAGGHTCRDVEIQSNQGLRWIQLSIHPICNNAGGIDQLIIEGTDIDQRKKMASQAIAAEERRKAFRVQAPMAVIEWDTRTYQIKEWNAAAENLFGFTVDEACGKSPDFLTPHGVHINKENIVHELSSGHSQSKVISKNHTKDGHIIHCEWYNSPIVDNTGGLIAAMSIVRDITAEKRAQHVLLNREAEQREILNSILDAVFTLDETTKTLSFNQAAENLFGYPAQEVIGQSCLKILPDHHREQLQYFLQRYIESGDQKYLGVSGDIEGLRKDGTIFPSRISIATLKEKRPGKHRFIVSMQDLSRFKQQEEQLRRSQKMDALGKLTGGIAHDFNNMLGIITGYADLLQTILSDQPKPEKYAREIARAGERGAQLTKKLLGFSQQKISTAEVVNINVQLDIQEHMLKKSLTPRITLAFDFQPNLWPTYIDSGDLEDAVLNISINAMHAMPEGGKLSIRTRNIHSSDITTPTPDLPPGDYVLLDITDTGCGMDEQTRERIFDPFFSTKGDLGTGLGLSQVYGFIERSKGLIKTHSKIGHGTGIAIYLPRHHAEVTNNIKTPMKGAFQASLQGQESILVVDDEVALLNLTTAILSQQGYHVIPANSAKQALNILKSTPVSLLLSDVIMPEIDGYELAAIVQEQYPKVKIQLVSGFTDDRSSGNSNATLQKNLIQKPYRATVLLEKLRVLLAQPPATNPD